MSIVVSCNCGKKFKARDEMAGKKVRCPQCKEVLRIPGAAGDSGAAAVAAPSSRKSSGAKAEKVDAQSALLRYEAAQKQKALDAEAQAAYKLEQQKIIESYDQLAGKASPTDLANKKNKEELTETTASKKPTVVTKAADATGSFFSNLLVKYLIIASLLGGGAYGSVKLVTFFMQSVKQDMGTVVIREDRVKSLMNEARVAIENKEFQKATKLLDDVLKLDASKERNRTYMAYRERIANGIAGKP